MSQRKPGVTVHFSVWLLSGAGELEFELDDSSLQSISREAEVAGACHNPGHVGGEPIVSELRMMICRCV